MSPGFGLELSIAETGKAYKKKGVGNSLVAQWLGFHVLTAESPSLIPVKDSDPKSCVVWAKKIQEGR